MKTALLLLFSIASLWALDVVRPPFVVENEPIPPAVTLNYSFGSNGIHEGMFDVYPSTIGKSSAFYLYPNIGFMGDGYGSSDTLPQLYVGAYAGFLASGDVREKFVWTSYHSIGAFGDTTVALEDGLKYFQISLLGWKWKPHFSTSLGVLINSALGEPVIVPLLKISYAKPKFVLEGTLPLTASARWMINDNWHLVGAGKLFYAHFASEQFQNAVEINRFEVMIRGERRIAGWLWGAIGCGYMGETEFKFLPDTEAGSIEDGFRARVQFLLRPE